MNRAYELFLVHGQQQPDPGNFSLPIQVMREMGWSWQDFLSAPMPVVEEIVVRLQAQQHWTSVKAEQLDREKKWKEYA